MCKECMSASNFNNADEAKMNHYWDEFVEDIRKHFHPDDDILFYADFINKYNRTPFSYFLEFIPEPFRQYYNCYSCKSFINKYGRLCYIDANTGELISAVWNSYEEEDNPFFKFSAFMESAIKDCRVSAIYLNTRNDSILGNATVRGDYTHLWIEAPKMIARLENPSYCDEMHKTFMRHVHSIPRRNIDLTISLLENDVLNRKEKFIEPVKYIKHFLETEDRITDRNKKYNIGWSWSVYAYDGVWNIKNSAIGRFMESIEENGSEAAIKEFNKTIVNPLKYQRPTKEVTIGGATRANQLFKELNISPSSLQRRFATWNEVKEHAIWISPSSSAVDQDNDNDPFSYMIDKSSRPIDKKVVKNINISKDEFINKILSSKDICGISIYSGSMNIINNHIVCLVGPNQQINSPILYYDHEDQRNPYSWFVLHSGMDLYNAYTYDTNVVGIIRTPNQWYKEDKSGIDLTIMVLENANCNLHVNSCLFPELLRKELHEVRAVIEKYSKDHLMYHPDNNEPLALGLCIDNLNGTKSIGLKVEYPEYCIVYNIF